MGTLTRSWPGYVPEDNPTYAIPVTTGSVHNLTVAVTPGRRGVLGWVDRTANQFRCAVVSDLESCFTNGAVPSGDVLTVYSGGTRAIWTGTLWEYGGELYAFISTFQGGNGRVECYKANDVESPTSWTLRSTLINNTSGTSTAGLDLRQGGIPTVTATGRWILPFQSWGSFAGSLLDRIGIFTSDDSGLTWTVRVNARNGALSGGTAGPQSTTVGWEPDTDDYWFGSHMGPVNQWRPYQSTDNGTTWATNENSIAGGPTAHFYMDDGVDMYAGIVSTNAMRLYRVPPSANPTDSTTWTSLGMRGIISATNSLADGFQIIPLIWNGELLGTAFTAKDRIAFTAVDVVPPTECVPGSWSAQLGDVALPNFAPGVITFATDVVQTSPNYDYPSGLGYGTQAIAGTYTVTLDFHLVVAVPGDLEIELSVLSVADGSVLYSDVQMPTFATTGFPTEVLVFADIEVTELATFVVSLNGAGSADGFILPQTSFSVTTLCVTPPVPTPIERPSVTIGGGCVLGCPETRVYMMDFMGTSTLFDLTNSVSFVKWTRELNNNSEANVSLHFSGDAAGRSCCEHLEQARTWRNEILIVRDGEPVWGPGPIVTIRVQRDIANLVARDAPTAWLDKRVVHTHLKFKEKDLSTIAEACIRDALTLGPAKLLPVEQRDCGILELASFTPTTIHTDYEVKANQRNVGEILRDLSQLGLDFTVINRSLTVGREFAFGPIGPLRDEDFIGDLMVAEHGLGAANKWYMSSDKTQGSCGGPDDFYGLLEEAVEGQPATSKAHDLGEQACSRLATTNPPPLVITVPSDSRLSQNAAVCPRSLVPGTLVDMTIRDLCRPASVRERLTSVRFTVDNRDEAVGITLAPLGDSGLAAQEEEE